MAARATLKDLRTGDLHDIRTLHWCHKGTVADIYIPLPIGQTENVHLITPSHMLERRPYGFKLCA